MKKQFDIRVYRERTTWSAIYADSPGHCLGIGDTTAQAVFNLFANEATNEIRRLRDALAAIRDRGNGAICASECVTTTLLAKMAEEALNR